MLCCQFLCRVLKAIFFITIALKLSYFYKKGKIFERWGLRPQTPVPPADGGFAPKTPTSGGWEYRPQTPIGLWRLRAPSPRPQTIPFHCKFLATYLVIYCSIILMFWGIIVQVSQYIVMFVCFYCYLSSAVIFLLIYLFVTAKAATASCSEEASRFGKRNVKPINKLIGRTKWL